MVIHVSVLICSAGKCGNCDGIVVMIGEAKRMIKIKRIIPNISIMLMKVEMI